MACNMLFRHFPQAQSSNGPLQHFSLCCQFSWRLSLSCTVCTGQGVLQKLCAGVRVQCGNRLHEKGALKDSPAARLGLEGQIGGCSNRFDSVTSYMTPPWDADCPQIVHGRMKSSTWKMHMMIAAAVIPSQAHSGTKIEGPLKPLKACQTYVRWTKLRPRRK